MPKINLAAVVHGLDGKAIKNGGDELELLLDKEQKPVRAPSGEPLAKLNADGTPVVKKPAPDLTVKDVCTQALHGFLPSDKAAGTPEGKDVAAKMMLAIKLHSGGEQALSAEEVTLLKDRVREMFAPQFVVVFRVCGVLDPSDKDFQLPKEKAK